MEQYQQPGLYKKKVFHFSKQYRNPKTRLLKLGSIIYFEYIEDTVHNTVGWADFPPK